MGLRFETGFWATHRVGNGKLITHVLLMAMPRGKALEKRFISQLLLFCRSCFAFSEFAGCALSFKGAMLVNPYDPDKVAESIHAALAMPVRIFVGDLNAHQY